MPALGWLTDAAAAAAAAQAGERSTSRELLAARGTVYLLGAEEAQAAPLVCALTGHIAREARRLAGHQPGGRLDPPLTLALDEAALICPVPLDQWTADMGGRGVTILAAPVPRAAAPALGRHGAAAILNNTAALWCSAAPATADDLAAWSTLAGERDEDAPTWDRRRPRCLPDAARVPVLSPAQIANLPAGTCVRHPARDGAGDRPGADGVEAPRRPAAALPQPPRRRRWRAAATDRTGAGERWEPRFTVAARRRPRRDGRSSVAAARYRQSDAGGRAAASQSRPPAAGSCDRDRRCQSSHRRRLAADEPALDRAAAVLPAAGVARRSPARTATGPELRGTPTRAVLAPP